MEDNDDDFFSDDGFDSLPPDTLLQLEQDAIARRAAQQHAQPVSETWNIARNNVPEFQDDAANPSAYDDATTLKLPSHLHTGFTSEYGTLEVGELDAEVLDGDDQSVVALEQPLPAFQARFPDQQYQQQYQPVEGFRSNVEVNGHAILQHDWDRQRREANVDRMEVEDEYGTELDFSNDPVQYGAYDSYQNVQELAARIDELTRRNEQVKQELATAKATAETKIGEISIVRSNQVRLTENYDNQLDSLRKTMAEEISRHREEVEAARAEGKILATENAFLKHDLAEETHRMENRKLKRKSSKSEDREPPVTPRKTKVLPFRDGFDDDEIAMVSPSKSKGNRSKRGTPTVPGKRKRKESQDAPIPFPPLRLSPKPATVDDVPGYHDMSDRLMTNVEGDETLSRSEGDLNVRWMKDVLNHRTSPNEETDMELMGKIAFPSEPRRMLSAIVLEEASKLESGNYLVDHGRAIASLWSRALKERYYKPIPIFLSIIRFIFSLDAFSSAPTLMEHLVPVLQESAEVNGVPRFKYSPVSRQSLGQIRQIPVSELQSEVDSTGALSLLYKIAYTCFHMETAMQSLWRHIRYDFILMTLNCAQPIKDIILSLNLLTTSVRPDTFGPILETEQDQRANEAYIVDRAANLLSETLQMDEGQEQYTAVEISAMHLEALSFLTSVAFEPAAPHKSHGSSVIAAHPTVLARLVRAMHDELEALYSYPPERDMRTSMVNGLMRLIYGVMRMHHGDSDNENVDLQSKLRRVAGGKQKFLVVLTRLAFSDGPILEAGITDETVEMAHEILDGAVNPQEAEALLEVFPSGRPPESDNRDWT